jgi:hypothetical protein
MIREWWERYFGSSAAPGPSTSLDDLVEEIAQTPLLDRRRALWAEIVRRFVHDVDRACRIAAVPECRERTGQILQEALRWIGSEPAKYFSRELVRVMRRHLGDEPVRQVLRSLYLRQFLGELPPRLVPYAEGLLNQEGHVEWVAEARCEGLEEVRKRCEEAWRLLPVNIEKEYDDEEISDRTDGIWSILLLREADVS